MQTIFTMILSSSLNFFSLHSVTIVSLQFLASRIIRVIRMMDLTPSGVIVTLFNSVYWISCQRANMIRACLLVNHWVWCSSVLGVKTAPQRTDQSIAPISQQLNPWSGRKVIWLWSDVHIGDEHWLSANLFVDQSRQPLYVGWSVCIPVMAQPHTVLTHGTQLVELIACAMH